MAYKGRLVEFSKKIGDKIYQNSEKIRDASSLWDNKEGNTQGMCIFWGKIRDENYQNSEANKGCF